MQTSYLGLRMRRFKSLQDVVRKVTYDMRIKRRLGAVVKFEVGVNFSEGAFVMIFVAREVVEYYWNWQLIAARHIVTPEADFTVAALNSLLPPRKWKDPGDLDGGDQSKARRYQK